MPKWVSKRVQSKKMRSKANAMKRTPKSKEKKKGRNSVKKQYRGPRRKKSMSSANMDWLRNKKKRGTYKVKRKSPKKSKNTLSVKSMIDSVKENQLV